MLGLLAVLAAGCMRGAYLEQVTDSGGVVVYPFKEEHGGPMQSKFRPEALRLMEGQCPKGYSVMKEGEARAQGYTSGKEGEGSTVLRYWALQFRCK